MSPLPTASDLATRLVRFPTVNPPGDEGRLQDYLRGLLESAGLSVEVFEAEPGRPNLVSSLEGAGTRPGLVLHGHVDVVGVEDQIWSVPPFEGAVHDGVLWGRGTLDMKAGVAMMARAMMESAVREVRPSGDVALVIATDSETGGSTGLGYLLADHPETFEGSAYAIGEFGGFPLYAFGQKFYRIGVGLKQYLHLRLRIRGRGGHGSGPAHETVTGRLGGVLATLDAAPMPYHRGRIAEQVIRSLAERLPGEAAALLEQLLDSDRFLPALEELGPLASTFEGFFRDTANATIVSAGKKFNVLPAEATIEIDARILPGRSPGQVIDHLRATVEPYDVDIEVVAEGPPSVDGFDDALLEELGDILQELDPEAVPIPYLFNESPDGRLFAAHGIQHYGYLPMDLPPEIDLPALIHGPDERVPLTAVDFGAAALSRLIERY